VIAGEAYHLIREAGQSVDISQVVFLCKQGNDSQTAAAAFQRMHVHEGVIGVANAPSSTVPIVRDVRGGLRAWSKHIDPTFPAY
jgi:adenylyltransferase/sulfurtransferase